jgi:hypothetical protein
MKERFIFETIMDSVPQWFETTESQKAERTLNIGSENWFVGSHRRLTPDLIHLFNFCATSVGRWLENVPPIYSSTYRKQITQEIAMFWLTNRSADVNWYKLISYAEGMLSRTYENIAVTANLIISQFPSNDLDITDSSIQKLIDPIATSMQTFIRIDGEARLISYEQITWTEINDSTGYKFSPEFLQPFSSILEKGEFSLHITSKGDVIILNSSGLLVSCRKGRWHIYDSKTLKNCIGDISGNYYIGCNIFEVLLDLSYKRHGALLIYAPSHSVIKHVINRDSLIANAAEADPFRAALAPSVKDISMGGGSSTSASRKKRIMLELASLDGAVIFDDSNILAFGAMIETHPNAGNHTGARTTAFESSFLFGGKPFKVSSDGDISLRFQAGSGKLNFL